MLKSRLVCCRHVWVRVRNKAEKRRGATFVIWAALDVVAVVFLDTSRVRVRHLIVSQDEGRREERGEGVRTERRRREERRRERRGEERDERRMEVRRSDEKRGEYNIKKWRLTNIYTGTNYRKLDGRTSMKSIFAPVGRMAFTRDIRRSWVWLVQSSTPR